MTDVSDEISDQPGHDVGGQIGDGRRHDGSGTARDALGRARTPEECGIASGAVLDLVDSLEDAGLDPHSLMLVRHGRIAAAGWWAPYRRDDITLLYSLSKSFTATAVGFAVREGLIDLDATLASYRPDAAAGPRARLIRIRHLLAMATGHEADTLPGIDPADPIRSFLDVEPDVEPGHLFTYNNGATLVLAALLTGRTGQDPGDYLQRRLFDPLGIGRWHWQRAGAYQQGFSGLHLATDAVARLGQTYLDGGSFAGRRVLPDGWAAQASATHTENAGRAENIDWQQGYGFQFWRSRHGFRGDGAFGQFCLVLPERDMVLAATSATTDMQGYLDRVWQVLLPGVREDPLPPDAPGAARLAARLDSLRLPGPGDAAGGGPATPAAGNGQPGGHSVESGAGLPVTGDAAAALGLTSAAITPAGAGWTLSLGTPAGSYPVPVTAGGFARREFPAGDGVLTLAGCGGWAAGTRFVADVVLLNTPHRFRLTADTVTGSAETLWHTAPFQPSALAEWAIPAGAE